MNGVVVPPLVFVGIVLAPQGNADSPPDDSVNFR